jgi:hypothetical protein
MAEESIFVPSKQDYRTEYPELTEMEEFEELSDYELKFVWYYSCKSSPIIKIKPADRAIAAVEAAYPEKERFGDSYKRLRTGDFDPLMQNAIRRMSTFNPSKRNKASKMIEKILNNYESLIDIEKERLQIMEFSEKKAYIEMTKTVSEVLPKIIDQSERNFGVSKRKPKKDNTDFNLMDSIVSSNI